MKNTDEIKIRIPYNIKVKFKNQCNKNLTSMSNELKHYINRRVSFDESFDYEIMTLINKKTNSLSFGKFNKIFKHHDNSTSSYKFILKEKTDWLIHTVRDKNYNHYSINQKISFIDDSVKCFSILKFNFNDKTSKSLKVSLINEIGNITEMGWDDFVNIDFLIFE